jgi:hypothetical protein
MSAPLLDARWPGGPKICPAENLPAFQTAAGLDGFLKANSPSCKVVSKWQCATCGHWHAYTIAPDPAGGSSGTGRSSKFSNAEEWRLFFAAKTPGEFLDAQAALEAEAA